MLLYPNAKINLGLNVVEKRNDGYHNIETVFYPIGLSDQLEVNPSETCSDYSYSSAGIEIGDEPENNLIIKAYRLLQSDFQLPPVDITLVKKIPFGAGLGGGSSDAAFMLKALNKLFILKLSTRELERYASVLGADCPVFIKNKSVFAYGIGNEFVPVQLTLKGLFLILVKPDIHVSTPEAYSLVKPEKPSSSLIDEIQKPIQEWKNSVKNDFEKSVFFRYPEIAKIKYMLYDMGAIYASMSGSGSAVFGIFDFIPTKSSVFDNYFVSGGVLK